MPKKSRKNHKTIVRRVNKKNASIKSIKIATKNKKANLNCNQSKEAKSKTENKKETNNIKLNVDIDNKNVSDDLDFSNEQNGIINNTTAASITRKNFQKKKIFFVCLVSFLVIVIGVAIFLALSFAHVETPTKVEFDGEVVSWNIVEDADYYLVVVNGIEYKTEEPIFDTSSLFPGKYKASVYAVKNSNKESKPTDFNFEIEKHLLKVIAAATNISKTYDGDSNYKDYWLLNEHYIIDKSELKYGTDVDISIVDVKFNSPNVETANQLKVSYSAILQGNDAKNYCISSGDLFLEAKILPKTLFITPPVYTKQFADSDELSDEVIDDELNQIVPFQCVRQTGEQIGFYDIISAISQNLNYTISVKEDSGKNKFEIIPRIVNVKSTQDSIVSKVYDGSKDFEISKLDSNIYIIENVVAGYDVEIDITSAQFNSENVSDCNILSVCFSGTLLDSNGVYKVIKSSFDVNGCILPKPVKIAPDRFIKEFGYDDLLAQKYYDNDLKQTIGVSFERIVGEAIGIYDIISVHSSSSNYEFEIFENSGKNKFEIQKRTLLIKTIGHSVEKAYDGNLIYEGTIVKNIHYELIGEIDGFAVDINILTAYFDFSTVGATQVTAEFSDLLNDENEFYRITAGEIILPARINRKQIEIIPQVYEKQYGDSKNLTTTYFDDETDTTIQLVYIRNKGEAVGKYDLLSAESKNKNYEFQVKNAENKFIITKRKIKVIPTGETLTKVFDNSDVCDLIITKGSLFTFENIVNAEEPDIHFVSKFNRADITADGIVLSELNLTEYSDRYELINSSIVIPAKITKKPIEIEPEYYSIQYGDIDYIKQEYHDKLLGLSFGVKFIREPGNEKGTYDICSAIPDNANYDITVINGEGKFHIAPRVLGVEILKNTAFSKVYDGTSNCTLPITLGLHYNLTNQNGGTNVTLKIISQEYDSKNVTEATKVIVRYAAILDGAGADQYITVGGTMKFDAHITPKPIIVTPNRFDKDYLSTCTLSQNVLDDVSGELIPVTFVTTIGEDHTSSECGVYDIVTINWTDTNHTFTLADGAGKDKFFINRIHLEISATNRNTVYNKQGQGINEPHSSPTRTLRVLYKQSSAAESAFNETLPVNADSYTARVVFDGDHNYLPQYVDRTLFIERLNSVITNTTPTDCVYNGEIRPITATLNHSEAALVFSRNNYVNAGTYNYILISVPQTQNYKATSITVSLTIAKRILNNSDIAYPTAGSIIYEQYLYSSILTGGSELGHFAWKDSNVRPTAGNHQYTVSFTPIDTDNYDWSNVDMERQVDLVVNKFIVREIQFPSTTGIVYTNALSTSKLIGTCSYGIFSWQNPDFVPSASGDFNVVFIPYDEENYDFSNIERIQLVYVEVSYRTYFQTNGGSEISPMVVGEISSAPYTYREGYVFDGWFTDEILLKRAEFPFRITEDTVLYAGWYSEGLIFIHHDDYYSVKLDALTIEQNIFIPSVYRDLPVTTIENNGFRNCTALEVIVIPQSVVSIGHNAFSGCVNLAFVQIINGIENINFGIDWIETGYFYGTDVYFNAEACLECEGTTGFHQSGCKQENIEAGN